MVAVAQACPAAGLGNSTLYSTFGVVTTTVSGRANSNNDPLERRQPRRIEMLDHFDDRRRVEARQPLVAVGQRAVQQLDPLRSGRSAGGPACSRVGRDLQRPVRHVQADDLARTAAPPSSR